jgi:hypothetical protein
MGEAAVARCATVPLAGVPAALGLRPVRVAASLGARARADPRAGARRFLKKVWFRPRGQQLVTHTALGSVRPTTP